MSLSYLVDPTRRTPERARRCCSDVRRGEGRDREETYERGTTTRGFHRCGVYGARSPIAIPLGCGTS
ncbi:hypothetical protein [Sorangium sp. So ce385]|uniref:hypothetical protein n=1 Tax=Sorangium sp. So ce385 TaxID=3133308 RepID=UPI003F5BA8A0